MTTTTDPMLRELLALFSYLHLPPHLQAASKPFHDVATHIIENCDGGTLFQATNDSGQ